MLLSCFESHRSRFVKVTSSPKVGRLLEHYWTKACLAGLVPFDTRKNPFGRRTVPDAETDVARMSQGQERCSVLRHGRGSLVHVR